jgi:hypothetical protein
MFSTKHVGNNQLINCEMASLQGHVSSFIEWDRLTGENVSENRNMIFHGKLLHKTFLEMCFAFAGIPI